MSAEYDSTEFVDTDFQAHKTAGGATSAAAPAGGGAGFSSRPPSREEVEAKINSAHKQLAELKRAQEGLERERAALEETRRRQTEFQTGRQEMITHLTRGLGLLEEAEFAARRDAEQLSRTLADFRDVLGKLQAINELGWGKESFGIELTRALTTIENARMEWNSARLKFPVLAGAAEKTPPAGQPPETQNPALAQLSLGQLCKLGLGLTWPLAVVVLLGFLALLLWRGR
jgi:hypothetical protein